MWIRHVLVPDITTDENDLMSLAEFINSLKTVSKVEVLPYHRMGIPKYESLGIRYPISEIEPPTQTQIDRARSILCPDSSL